MDPTKLFAACFVGSLVVTWLLTPLVAPLARRLGAVDAPDPRKLHRQPTPHLGGLAIFGGLVIGSLAYGFFMGWDRFFGMFASESHLALLVPCGLVFAVGLLDDFIALSPYSLWIVCGQTFEKPKEKIHQGGNFSLWFRSLNIKPAIKFPDLWGGESLGQYLRFGKSFLTSCPNSVEYEIG